VLGLALVALGGCDGGSTGRSDIGGEIGGRVHTTNGSNGTNPNNLGNATLTGDGRFGFEPGDARVQAGNGRAVVSIDDIAYACGAPDQTHLTLSFGTDGVPLTAGSYLVDGGATIVWSQGLANGPAPATAVSGLINCNSVSGGEVAGSFSALLPLEDGGLSLLTGIFTAIPCTP
jgi:hypothetical protein